MLAQASTPATVNIPLAPYPPPQPPGPPPPPHRTAPPPSRAKKTPSTCASSGSGPAGQSAAIRLSNPKLETRPSFGRPVTSSGMRSLVESYVIQIPHPPQMHNKANSITGPSSVVAWLGDIREEMGVEVYSATQFLFFPPARRERRARQEAHEGVALPFRARVTLLAGGAHASVGKHAVAMYDLGHEKEAQMYEIGVKEAWRVECARCTSRFSLSFFFLPFPFLPLFIPFYSTPRGQSTPHPRLGALRTHLRWEHDMADGLFRISPVVGLDSKNQYIES
ncbi:hypothetical protein K438DRAFT_1986166 [Mycena galopus ATCC 62051]|nr:hypothetical protein K438DRAFT_1986166 [Mycena galopus ATCC 62051]